MPLRIGRKQTVFKSKYLQVIKKDFADANGNQRSWYYIKRKKVIMIFPITPEQKVVLIKNFRVPLERYIIEIPAGLKDVLSESDEETARRELLEETGYVAKKFIPVPPWPYRSGSSSDMIIAFFAIGLRKVKEKLGDSTEDIQVMEVPMKKLMEFYFKSSEELLPNPEILGLYYIALKKKIKG